MTAMQVVKMLRELADEGRVVICTIHQPSTEVFGMFDTLLLLAKPADGTGGNVAFFGPLPAAETFFAEICGLPIPFRTTAASHYIQQITPVTQMARDGTLATLNQERILHIVRSFDDFVRPGLEKHVSDRLVHSLEEHGRPFANGQNKFHTQVPQRISFWSEFVLLLHMHLLLLTRNPRTSLVRLVQALFLSLIGGLIYLQLDSTQAGLQNRVGALFFLVNQVFMGSLLSVLFILPLDRPVFLREHANNSYGALSYWNAKSLIEFPYDVFMSFVYGILSYWMIGLQSGYHYAVFMATFILVGNAASSIGFFISAGVKNQETAMIIAPIAMIPLMVFGGFFIQAGSIPVFLDWIKYISPFYYGFPVLVNNELSGLNFTCTAAQLVPSGVVNGSIVLSCPFTTGDAYLSYIGFADVNILFDLGMLGVLTVGYRLCSMLIFLLVSNRLV